MFEDAAGGGLPAPDRARPTGSAAHVAQVGDTQDRAPDRPNPAAPVGDALDPREFEPPSTGAGLDGPVGSVLAAAIESVVGDLPYQTGGNTAPDPGFGVAPRPDPGSPLGHGALGRVSDVTDRVLVDTAAAAQRLEAWCVAARMQAGAELVRRRSADEEPVSPPTRWGGDNGFVAAVAELAIACGVSEYATAALLDLACGLPQHLPATYADLASGTLEWAKARLIYEKTRGLDPVRARHVEEQVLPHAAGWNRPVLAARLDAAVAAADPAAAAARARNAHAERRIRFSPLPDAMGQMSLTSSAIDIETLRHHLDALTAAARAERARGAHPDQPFHGPADSDGRHPAAVRADVLLDLVRAAADELLAPQGHHADQPPEPAEPAEPAGPATPRRPAEPTQPVAPDVPTGVWEPADAPDRADPSAAGPPARLDPIPRSRWGRGITPAILALVPLSTLLACEETPGYLDGYGPIPAQLARDLAATGTWRCAAVDDDPASPGHGTLVGLGRSTYTPGYTPTHAGREYITLRDRTCRFPGCRRHAATCDLDHRIAWQPDQPTVATCDCNLHALCRTHHRLKHNAGFGVAQHPTGDTWTTPTGHTHTSAPEPLPGTAPPPPRVAVFDLDTSPATGPATEPGAGAVIDPDPPPPF